MDKITLLELHRLEKKLKEVERKASGYVQDLRVTISRFVLEFANEEDLRIFYEIIHDRYGDEDGKS